jgi:2-hydroxycyclohexanecarboxyl-CoA dehydrogenase
MMEAGRGRIVNISSSSTHSGQPFMAHCVVVKSAVNGLTKSLALEYGPSGVTVNALPPRFIDTPMLRKSRAGPAARWHGGGSHRTHFRAADGQARGRRGGVAFFVSEEAGYITGQILGVNGGRNT